MPPSKGVFPTQTIDLKSCAVLLSRTPTNCRNAQRRPAECALAPRTTSARLRLVVYVTDTARAAPHARCLLAVLLPQTSWKPSSTHTHTRWLRICYCAKISLLWLNSGWLKRIPWTVTEPVCFLHSLYMTAGPRN